MGNGELVARIYEAFQKRDMDAIRAFLADDIKWTVSGGFPYAGTYCGFGEIMASVMGHIADDWENFRHDLAGTIECGGDVLVSGTYLGTWKRTGRTIEAPFVHVWTIADGRAATFHQYVDGPSTKAATDGFVHANE